VNVTQKAADRRTVVSKALVGTQNTNTNRWRSRTGLILSLSIKSTLI